MRALGDTAVLLDTDDPQGLARALRPLVTDAIPAATTVGVVGDLPDPLPDPVPARSGRTHEIPVCFDGEDIDVLPGAGEREWDLEVAFLGFMPGFAYLKGMPDLPRRPSPRTSVPLGSFAAAGGYAGIYPVASPGGWNLLGRTNVTLFDVSSPPYALLAPGDRVRIVPVSDLPPAKATALPHDPSATPDQLGRGLIVEDPGLLALVQDAGRLGLGSIGVPRAGAANEFAHRAGNLAVGNEAGAAVVELLGTSRFTSQLDLRVVLVSFDRSATLVADTTPLAANHVHQIGAGQRLAINAPRRAWLAVAGGISTPLVLGSRSSDRSLPPGPLVAGTVLPPGTPPDRARRNIELPPWEAVIRLRAILGPDPVPEAVVRRLTHRRLVVAPESDRTGVRLVDADTDHAGSSPHASDSRATGEADGRDGAGPADLDESHAVVPGAIQVTPDGQPVILGPDCGPIGGYAVAATVISADLWRVGNLAPGDEVEVSLVSLAYAATARARLEAAIAGSVRGWFPTRVG